MSDKERALIHEIARLKAENRQLHGNLTLKCAEYKALKAENRELGRGGGVVIVEPSDSPLLRKMQSPGKPGKAPMPWTEVDGERFAVVYADSHEPAPEALALRMADCFHALDGLRPEGVGPLIESVKAHRNATEKHLKELCPFGPKLTRAGCEMAMAGIAVRNALALLGKE